MVFLKKSVVVFYFYGGFCSFLWYLQHFPTVQRQRSMTITEIKQVGRNSILLSFKYLDSLNTNIKFYSSSI